MVRRLVSKDVAAVRKIAAECFPKVWTEEEFLYFIENANGLALGIEKEGELVAYFLGLLILGELDIVSLGVAKAHRRQNLAEKMMTEALNGVSKAYLEVDETNAAAIALYLKQGFKKMGIRKKYYEGIRDAWFMRWPS